jgi:hypothetical protein
MVIGETPSISLRETMETNCSWSSRSPIRRSLSAAIKRHLLPRRG